jgi:aromatic-L-amino-acid/L-tryptophan decarboxylase
MRSYGLSGLQDYIRRTIRLGLIFADLVREREDLFEIMTKPAFALTVFQVRNPDRSAERHRKLRNSSYMKPDEASNALTRRVYEAINEQGEIYITSTVIAGVYVIRVVSANEAAEEKYIRRAFDILVQTTESVLQERNASRL